MLSVRSAMNTMNIQNVKVFVKRENVKLYKYDGVSINIHFANQDKILYGNKMDADQYKQPLLCITFYAFIIKLYFRNCM